MVPGLQVRAAIEDAATGGVQAVVLAGEIGQVRDMLGAVSSPDAVPHYHRTLREAVAAASARPHPASAKEG